MTQSTVSPPTIEEVFDTGVSDAARAFAQALAESEEFQAFEQTTERLREDEAAQKAIGAFQKKQQSLQMMLRLNAVSAEDRAELERLQQAFLAEPSVAAYLQAQENLTAVCQAAADVLTQRIGLSFTAACGPGCC